MPRLSSPALGQLPLDIDNVNALVKVRHEWLELWKRRDVYRATCLPLPHVFYAVTLSYN
jgi:hypothetical protein